MLVTRWPWWRYNYVDVDGDVAARLRYDGAYALNWARRAHNKKAWVCVQVYSS